MKQLRQWLSAVALLAGLSTASGAEPERSAIIKLAVHDRDQGGQLRTSNGLDGDAKQNLNFTPAGGTSVIA